MCMQECYHAVMMFSPKFGNDRVKPKKHTQTPGSFTLSFLDDPVLNSAELDTLRDLDRCWG